MNNNRTTITQRFSYLGFALGILSMVGVFVFGAVNGIAPAMVMASSVAAGLGGALAAAHASFNRKPKAAVAGR